jgi:Amt family ammonium transporter
MGIDPLWMLSCALLVMLMQAGFTCLESGMVRSKNSINVAIKNLIDFCISVVLFALLGYGLMFGTSLGGWIGIDGIGVPDSTPQVLAFFFFQAMFCGTATTIVSGAVAERMRFVSYAFTALLLSGFIYPIAGHWAWARDAAGEPAGWLAQLGFIDFAGSTVVHSLAGWVALVAMILVGPRLGRFGRRGRVIEGHSLPIATLGVFLLWFGWFGFNAGSTFAFTAKVPIIMVNTALAGAVGGLVGMAASWRLHKRPMADAVMNGVLAGLVAITASCDLVSAPSAIVIGAGGALVAALVAELLVRVRIDDAIGAVPVHLGAGIWGTLAVALFAPTAAFGDLGRLGQLGVQALGVAAFAAFATVTALLGLLAYSRFGSLRVSPRDERIGLNIAEHGATTSLLDLLGQMDVQANSGDFSRPVKVEDESEASQVASFYNAVLEKFNIEIDRRKVAIQRLAELANHDPLTGLGNRRLFLDELRRAMNEAHPERQGALMFLDLDGFKAVNDTVGHDAGDALLKDVASRLRGIFGERGVLGRLGGDEFAVVVEGLKAPERDSAALAARIVESLDAPFPYGEQRLRIGASVGIVLFGDEALATVKGLTKRADEAMYEAKLAGKGTFRFFGRAAGV